MPVTRERVDPQRDQSDLGLVHRRWIVPDDVQRPMPLQNLSRLWRGLIELRVLDPGSEARLSRAGGETLELPVAASPGALLAGAGSASLITQVVWTDEEDRLDPYALEGEPDPEGFRDYTLYAIDVPGRRLARPGRACLHLRREARSCPRPGGAPERGSLPLPGALLPRRAQHRAAAGATQRRAPRRPGGAAHPGHPGRDGRAGGRRGPARGVIRPAVCVRTLRDWSAVSN